MDIPVILQATSSLVARLSHVIPVRSWGLTHLSLRCNPNYFGYMFFSSLVLIFLLSGSIVEKLWGLTLQTRTMHCSYGDI